MAKTLEEFFPHKFGVGDTVKVVARGESEWCKIGDTHKVRVCRHDHEDGAVYVVDDDDESAYIRECNLELVERDRQKGGEWKRHRGGKQPVADDVAVEYKLRNGYTDTWHARALSWSHAGGEGDVMKYRVISQPQAEEVEVKDTTIGTLSYKVELDTSPAMNALNELSAKWDQVESPLKWRDEVTELNAYIEKFTRERDSLIERLASEGFALIPAMTPVMGVADVDMSDWRNWEIGDHLKIFAEEEGHEFEIGQTVKVIGFTSDDESLPVKAESLDGDEYWFINSREAKFIRRP